MIIEKDEETKKSIGHKNADSSVIKTEKSESLGEKDAGITEYLGSHPGFTAIIKQRYSDFIVNEIDPDGNVVHLKDMNLPTDEKEKKDDKEADNKSQDSPPEGIPADLWAQLGQLTASGSDKINIPAPADKDERTSIHKAVKGCYPQLETSTVDVAGEKFIQAFWRRGKTRQRYDDWPASKKDFKFVKFVLYKENKDTMDMIGLMAKHLYVKESLFQAAGTKDRRGKTSQYVTAQRIHPKKLITLNKSLWNFGIGDFSYVKEPLKLGQLSGNHFTIVLRNVTASKDTVDQAIESLKAHGFINYFGMQRFGTTGIPTHSVGKALLSGDWNKAIDLILMPRDDQEAKGSFQSIWAETKDAGAALQAAPRFAYIERNLLGALGKGMGDFRALEQIHRNTRTLYVHSYQSYVWNLMVSRRLKEFGQKLILGDLVIKGGSGATELNPEKITPTLVTDKNINDFSLKDAVLPMPGHKVIYPDNEMKSWYESRLKEDGLDLNDMERKQRDYSLPGAYRHLVTEPTNVSWQHQTYDDHTLPLILSDFDLAHKKETLTIVTDGKMKAVVLEMSLPTSTYATMALREAMRVDTSARHQTSLSAS